MRVGCDIGGTFTDLIAVEPGGGGLLVGKALNSGYGATGGLGDALEQAGVEPGSVTELTHGTTTVTNLLIERTGAKVGLVTTRGFRDVLEIQLSFRQRTFDGHYTKTPPVIPRGRRLEIGGRIDQHGAELEPLDMNEVATVLERLRDDGVEALAVSLYNAYANPEHERTVAKLWAEVAPGLPVTCATDVDPRMGEYERVSTAVLNASAVPRMQFYVEEISEMLGTPTLYMHSAGGVLGPGDASEHPIELAFSGPAGGVLAGREVGAALGIDDLITLDMGGTSCDVCLIRGGEVRERESFEVAWGVPARIRSLDINTVGAGGGSIAWCDGGGALRVGPRSAGARPGPACYGRGGEEPTVTDANLALGIIPEAGLLDGKVGLDREAAERALATVGESFGIDATGLARAIHRSVNANMAQAVREITVRHGHDPRECALVAFGGAGPQHGAGVARELGISKVIVPAHSSLLSAVGLLAADVRVSATRTLLIPVEEIGGTPAQEAFDQLVEEAVQRLADIETDEVLVERWAGLRYRDQWHEVALPVGADVEDLVVRFEDGHERRFGTRLGAPVEVVDVWVTAIAPRVDLPPSWSTVGSAAEGGETPLRELLLHDATVPVLEPGAIGPEPIPGPCLVEEGMTVTVVPPGGTVRRLEGHQLLEGLDS